MLPVAAKYGMGILTWSPLSGGELSGKYRPGQAAKASHRDTRSWPVAEHGPA